MICTLARYLGMESERGLSLLRQGFPLLEREYDFWMEEKNK